VPGLATSYSTHHASDSWRSISAAARTVQSRHNHQQHCSRAIPQQIQPWAQPLPHAVLCRQSQFIHGATQLQIADSPQQISFIQMPPPQLVLPAPRVLSVTTLSHSVSLVRIVDEHSGLSWPTCCLGAGYHAGCVKGAAASFNVIHYMIERWAERMAGKSIDARGVVQPSKRSTVSATAETYADSIRRREPLDVLDDFIVKKNWKKHARRGEHQFVTVADVKHAVVRFMLRCKLAREWVYTRDLRNHRIQLQKCDSLNSESRFQELCRVLLTALNELVQETFYPKPTFTPVGGSRFTEDGCVFVGGRTQYGTPLRYYTLSPAQILQPDDQFMFYFTPEVRYFIVFADEVEKDQRDVLTASLLRRWPVDVVVVENADGAEFDTVMKRIRGETGIDLRVKPFSPSNPKR
jgi:hypothetical protein